MGTYYGLGVIHTFDGTSNRPLTHEQWVNILDKRVDTSLFDLRTSESKVKGTLREGVFNENIAGFYDVLREILGENRKPNIDYYEEEFGHHF